MKSLSWISHMGVLLLGALYVGIFKADFFFQTDARLAAGIGFFATLFGGIVFRAFRLDEMSGSAVHYCSPDTSPVGTILISYKNHTFTITRNQALEAYELSPSLMRFVVFSFFLISGFTIFQYKELNAVLTAPDRSYLGKPHYCKIENQIQEQEVIRPECRLIYRAFELGYVKDIGDCGRSEEGKPTVCDLQHRDEPPLHFAYRRIKRQVSSVVNVAGRKTLTELQAEFKKDVENFQPMVEMLLADINNEPTSAHMIFTNLPNPHSAMSQKYQDVMKKSHCMRWNQRLPNQIPYREDNLRASRYFEHSLGHLLFDTAYPVTVASCSEYQTIWEAPIELCERLSKNAEATLIENKLNDQFDVVLNYFRRKSTVRSKLKYRTPAEFLSLNCFTYGNEKTQLISRKVKYKGETINLRWMKLSSVSEGVTPSIAFFKGAARMLAEDFDYGAYYSLASFTPNEKSIVSEDTLQIDDFRLTRLGFLRDADVFLGAPWIEKRADLIDVYPFHLHLKHFVETFRDRYRRTRGQVQ